MTDEKKYLATLFAGIFRLTCNISHYLDISKAKPKKLKHQRKKMQS